MPPKIGRCPNKIGTHPHKQKKCQNMVVGFSHCCRRVVADCRQDIRTRTTSRWKGRRGLWTALPVVTHWQRTTTWQLAKLDNISQTTLHKSPCSMRPPLFTQPVKFNNTSQSTSHNPQHRQLRQPSRCTNSISTTTDNNIFWDCDTHAYFDSFHQSQ